MGRGVSDAVGNPVAVGGFADGPARDRGGPWSGFPALLLRIPELAVTRVRGRTYATAMSEDAEALLELTPTALRAPAARRLEVTAARNPMAWTAAVAGAAARLRAGEAAKVVLARAELARGGRAVSAATPARSLRCSDP